MNWIDVRRFIRMEDGKFGVGGLLLWWFKCCLVGVTIIGFPVMLYMLSGIRGIRTRRYLKKYLYDVEDTSRDIKIIKQNTTSTVLFGI